MPLLAGVLLVVNPSLVGAALVLCCAFILVSVFQASGHAIEDDTETHDSSMTEGF